MYHVLAILSSFFSCSNGHFLTVLANCSCSHRILALTIFVCLSSREPLANTLSFALISQASRCLVICSLLSLVMVCPVVEFTVGWMVMWLSLVVWDCCNFCYLAINTAENQWRWDAIVSDKASLKSATVKGECDLVGIFHWVTHVIVLGLRV